MRRDDMESWEIASHDHERTKHDFQRNARSTGYLDRASQPDPFRRYESAPLIPLLFSSDDESPAYDDLYAPGRDRRRTGLFALHLRLLGAVARDIILEGARMLPVGSSHKSFQREPAPYRMVHHYRAGGRDSARCSLDRSRAWQGRRLRIRCHETASYGVLVPL